MCVAQVCAQLGAYTWPSLLPTFMGQWQITNREAGWITGVFYAAYALAVPILVTATDRIDPRTVYLAGVTLTVASHWGFAALADGFWSALALRALAGVGWAGTYMTGLKLLADRVDARLMSRAVAGHAASIGIAGSLSFVFASMLNEGYGWRGAYFGAGLATLVAWVIVFGWVPSRTIEPKTTGAAPLFDFRPVLRNRSAMAYALAYCAHTWEMNSLRGWAVAFLAYVATSAGDRPWLAPASGRDDHGPHRDMGERAGQRGGDPTRAPEIGPRGHDVVHDLRCRDRIPRLAIVSARHVARPGLRPIDLARFLIPDRRSGGQRGSGTKGRDARRALDGRIRRRLRGAHRDRMDPRSVGRHVGEGVGARLPSHRGGDSDRADRLPTARAPRPRGRSRSPDQEPGPDVTVADRFA
jgi:hypothetical protein